MSARPTIRTGAVLAVLCSALLSFAAGAQETSQAALDALLVRSDLKAADALASEALRKNSKNLSALFVRMEVARLRLDEPTVISTALRICQIDADDPRAVIAAARLTELSGNTERFNAARPSLMRAVENGGAASSNLKLALVAAAKDAAPELDLLEQSREYGLLTDWRLKGPFGNQSPADFDRTWAPEKNSNWRKLKGAFSDIYQFPDGAVTLPDSTKPMAIYYAESEFDLPSSGTWRIRMQTLGTLEVFIDGKKVVRRDSRLAVLPEVSWETVRLDQGRHKTLVKFLASALPFRIAVVPPSAGPKKRKAPQAIHAGPESDYVNAALHYFDGDWEQVITSISQNSEQLESAPFLMLLGDAWTRQEEDPPEARSAYSRVFDLCWTCERSHLRLTSIELQTKNSAELRKHGAALARVRSRWTEASGVSARAFFALGEFSTAWSLAEDSVRQHPSVENLRTAMQIAVAQKDEIQANALARRLISSSEGALALSRARASQGRHKEAAHILETWAQAEPLNRALWMQYANELLMSQQFDAASTAAKHLLSLSPENDDYRELAERAEAHSPFRDSVPDLWFTNLRRPAEQILSTQPQTTAAVSILLSDRAWRIRTDGRVEEYVHEVTRLGNRAAINQHSEVTIPDDAEILNLRAFQPDGSTAEPELTPEKTSISMPGLTPGAVIETEYVRRHSPSAMNPPLDFLFGSRDAPMQRTRLVVVADKSIEMKFADGPGIPKAVEQLFGDLRILAWERTNLNVIKREPSAPDDSSYLASIRITTPVIQDQLREQLALQVQEKTRIGPRSRMLAAKFRDADPELTAKKLYEYVQRNVLQEEDSDIEDAPSAELSLSKHHGNRSLALIALARAAGLETDLVLASNYDQPSSFVHPLVRLQSEEKRFTVDAETDSLPFASLAPTLRREAALTITSTGEQRPSVLPRAGSEERSVASGNIRVERDGSLQAHIEIALGLTRGKELRRNLRTMTTGARQHFLEDVATRILPGVVSVSGEIRNEFSESPITIAVDCRTNNVFGNFVAVSQALRMQQLVPGLGLRSMFANSDVREQPIDINSVLFESTRFHITVPEGMELSQTSPDLKLSSPFGTYASQARRISATGYEFTREFYIPMQVIKPAQYGLFKAFTEQIDSAERSQVQVKNARQRS